MTYNSLSARIRREKIPHLRSTASAGYLKDMELNDKLKQVIRESQELRDETERLKKKSKELTARAEELAKQVEDLTISKTKLK